MVVKLVKCIALAVLLSVCLFTNSGCAQLQQGHFAIFWKLV